MFLVKTSDSKAKSLKLKIRSKYRTRAKQVREPGTWSRGEKRAGSRNSRQNSQNKGFPLKIEIFKNDFRKISNFNKNFDLLLWV
jgi:hypothetical protein